MSLIQDASRAATDPTAARRRSPRSQALAAWSARLPDLVCLLGGLAAVAASLAMLTGLSASSSYASAVLLPMLLLGTGGSAVMVTAQNMMTQGAGDDSGVAGAAVG